MQSDITANRIDEIMPEGSDQATLPDSPEPINDLLVNMYVKQLSHMQKYAQLYMSKGLTPVMPGEFGNINNPKVQAAIRETAGYFVEELYEAINLLKNKPWAQSTRSTNQSDFYEELADAWHFWLELLILCGMGPQEVQSHYFKKAATNDERRENGY